MGAGTSDDEGGNEGAERAEVKPGLVERARGDFAELRFVAGRKFAFRPPRTVVIGPEEPNDSLLFLHELGHVVSGHYAYRTDVARLRIEAEAWAAARKLAAEYEVEWDEDFAQEQLDSYRDWLHRKSRCPRCGLTRYQTPDGVYHCPKCEEL